MLVNVKDGSVSDRCTCSHAEIEHTCVVTQSPCTDTGPTSPSTDPITPGAWQGSHWSAKFSVTGLTRKGESPTGKASQQQASVSQGRICSDSFTCCHTETEVADPTFYLTQSQYTDTGPTSPSADPITPGAWKGQPLECQCLSHWYDSTQKKIPAQAGFEPGDLPLSRRTP